MSNIAKCVNIIKEKGADALILLDEANMHYLCSFSPSEGMIVIFSNGICSISSLKLLAIRRLVNSFICSIYHPYEHVLFNKYHSR